MLALSPLSKRGGPLLVGVSLALLSATGCQTGGPQAGGTAGATAPPAAVAPLATAGRYKVSAATTSFYRLGPQQPGGPDLGLKKDTRLTLTRRSFGFSQVQLDDGTAGYVGTEDLVRLTPEEIAAETKPLVAPAGPNARGVAAVKPGAAARRRARPAPNIPIIPGDEPGLPAAADPTPRTGPVPTFRY